VKHHSPGPTMTEVSRHDQSHDVASASCGQISSFFGLRFLTHYIVSCDFTNIEYWRKIQVQFQRKVYIQVQFEAYDETIDSDHVRLGARSYNFIFRCLENPNSWPIHLLLAVEGQSPYDALHRTISISMQWHKLPHYRVITCFLLRVNLSVKPSAPFQLPIRCAYVT
jgi:hypothetical protein